MSTIWKIGYSYAAKTGQLRNGALLIPAKNVEEAHQKGQDAVNNLGLLYASVNNVMPYQTHELIADTNKKK